MKCKPTRYAVISGQNITYGFRCKTHKIATKRYSTRELREERMAEHIQQHKKKSKKS